MSGNLRREIMELGSACPRRRRRGERPRRQPDGRVGSRLGGATSGLETMRGASVRMALLASGALAGVADALRVGSEAEKGE